MGATTLHTQLLLWDWRWCYGSSINSVNMVAILWISNSHYHSSCLNYNFGYCFEQIKKHHVRFSPKLCGVYLKS